MGNFVFKKNFYVTFSYPYIRKVGNRYYGLYRKKIKKE